MIPRPEHFNARPKLILDVTYMYNIQYVRPNVSLLSVNKKQYVEFYDISRV